MAGMWKSVATLMVAGASLAGCGTGRLLSYGTELGDAVVRMGPAAFSVYVHPTDDTLLIQRGTAQTSAADGPVIIGLVADQFLAPTGCTSSSPTLLTAGSWEAGFQCPAGVDLRALAASQRVALRAAQPIQLRTAP